MAVEQVLVEFVADTSQLEPSLTLLEKMGQIDKKVADSFRETNKEMEERTKATEKAAAAAGKQLQSTKELEKGVSTLADAMDRASGKALAEGLSGMTKQAKVAAQALQQTTKRIEETRKKMLEMEKAGKINTEEYEKLQKLLQGDEKAVKELTQGLEQLANKNKQTARATQETGEAQKSLSAQLREVKNELQALQLAGQEGTEAYEALRAQAGKLQLAIDESNQAIGRAASATKHLDNVIDGLRGMAAGYGLVTGATTLFGKQNAELEKVLTKVTGVMLVMQSLQQIQDLLNKKTTLSLGSLLGARKADAAATMGQAAATGTATAATEGMTIAQRALNVVMKANPIGLLVTAVTAAAAAFAFFTRNTKNNTEEMEANTKAIEANIEAVKRLRQLQVVSGKDEDTARIEALKTQIELLQAQGGEQQKLAQLTAELRQSEQAAAAKELQSAIALGKQYAENNYLRAAGGDVVDGLSRQLTDLAITIGVLNKQRANGKKLTEEEEKQITALNNRYNALSGVLTMITDARQKLLDASVQTTQVMAQNQDLAAERAMRSQIAAANSVLAHTLANSKEELDAKNKLIELAAKNELRNTELTQAERQAIIDRANRQILDNNMAFQLRAREQELQMVKLETDARLKEIADGSDEELALHIKVMEKERDLRIAQAQGDEKAIELIRMQFIAQRAKMEEDFAKRNNKRLLEVQKSSLQIQFDNAVKGTQEEIDIRARMLEVQAQMEIDAIDERVRMTEAGQQKIKEILNRVAVQKFQMQLEFDLKGIDDEMDRLKAITDSEVKENQRVLDSVRTTYAQRRKAEADILSIQLDRIGREKAAINDKINAEVEAARKTLGVTQLSAHQRWEIEKKYQADLTALEDEAAQLRFENDEKWIRRQIEARQKLVDETIQMLKDGLNATLPGSAETQALSNVLDLYKQIDEISKNNDLSGQEKTIAMIGASAVAVQATLNAVFQQQQAQRQAALASELKRLDDLKRAELANKDLTENQKAEIEKRFAARQRQEKIKAWKADQAAARTQAIINGALAVVKALPNLVLAGVAAAMTAVQVGIINRQPIPQFAKGTKRAPKGYALVGEEGPEIVYLQGGERIFTHKETKEILNNNFRTQTISVPNIGRPVTTNTKAPEFDYARLGKEIASNIPQSGINVDSNGFKAWVREGNTITKFKNERYSL